jgi:hypothetical protein
MPSVPAARNKVLLAVSGTTFRAGGQLLNFAARCRGNRQAGWKTAESRYPLFREML